MQYTKTCFTLILIVIREESFRDHISKYDDTHRSVFHHHLSARVSKRESRQSHIACKQTYYLLRVTKNDRRTSTKN